MTEEWVSHRPQQNPESRPLSNNAIRVLRLIYDRGLRVQWRYHSPSPEFNDKMPMSIEDYQIVEQELWRREEKSEYLVYQKSIWVDRDVVRNNILYHEKIYLFPEKFEFTVLTDESKFEETKNESKTEIIVVERNNTLEALWWKCKEKVLSDGLEFPAYREDGIVKQIFCYEMKGSWQHFTIKTSEWLTEEDITPDWMSEYNEGVLVRHILTEKARALIGIIS